MGDLSDSGPAPSVLDGLITETDLARQLNRSVRTLQRLAAARSGPPRIKVGRLIFYRIDSVCAWLAQQEKRPTIGTALPEQNFESRQTPQQASFLGQIGTESNVSYLNPVRSTERFSPARIRYR